ncbi:MAG: heparinase II/III-family protein, partial [Pseudomonadota bacterium]
ERIDRAILASGLRPEGRTTEVMGFHRIHTARSTVVFDGAGPVAEGADGQHASAFCFEASVGRRPMIVNCGPGAGFGDEWAMAARATAAHSGLTIDELSSSRLVTGRGRRVRLTGGIRSATCNREEDANSVRLIAEHDGYLASHGLIHRRRLTLSSDGGDFRGEDSVAAEGEGPRAAFDIAAGRGDKLTVPFTIRFHLHPQVEADIFLAGGAVRLKPPSGDLWVMRQLGGQLTIEDSVYLDDHRAAPRATKQIVVRAEATEYSGLVKWAFRRAEPEKPAPRDLAEATQD